MPSHIWGNHWQLWTVKVELQESTSEDCGVIYVCVCVNFSISSAEKQFSIGEFTICEADSSNL